jgi:hypothetical protein
MGIALCSLLLSGCVSDEPAATETPGPSTPPALEIAHDDTISELNPIHGRRDGSAASQLPQADAASGDFPLTADTLSLNWATPFELPLLPEVCNIQYSAGHTPFLAFGFPGATLQSECWDLSSGTRIGEIPEAEGIALRRSLSPDGRLIAFWLKGSETIEVWSYITGTRLQTIDVKEDGYPLSGILLASANHLITVSQRNVGQFQYENALKVFDVTTGQLLKTTPLSRENPSILSLAVSDGGRYLGYLRDDGVLEILESASLKSTARIPIRPLERAAAGCSFSADGTKLACMMSNASETKIYVASLQDGHVSEIVLPMNNLGLEPYQGPIVEWLPDQSGWVLFGQRIVSDKLRKQVWTLRCQGNVSANRRLTLQQSVLAVGSLKRGASGQFNPPELVQFQWPKAQIDASGIEGSLEGKTANTAPLVHVDVSVTVGGLRFGEVERTKEKLTAVIAEAVRVTGLKSSSLPANMQLGVNYQEAPGTKLYRREGSSLLIADSKLGGNGFQSTCAKMKFALRAPGSPESIWEAELVVDPIVVVIEGAVDEASIHAAVLKKTEQLLRTYGYPFYVDEQLTLPGESTHDL